MKPNLPLLRTRLSLVSPGWGATLNQDDLAAIDANSELIAEISQQDWIWVIFRAMFSPSGKSEARRQKLKIGTVPKRLTFLQNIGDYVTRASHWRSLDRRSKYGSEVVASMALPAPTVEESERARALAALRELKESMH